MQAARHFSVWSHIRQESLSCGVELLLQNDYYRPFSAATAFDSDWRRSVCFDQNLQTVPVGNSARTKPHVAKCL